MKYSFAILFFVLVGLAGCEYKAPLSEEHVIAIDPLVIGVWERLPDKDESQGEGTKPEDERVTVQKNSDTEYSVSFPVEGKELRLRAYPIKLGKIACLQLQFTEQFEALTVTEVRMYAVLSYQLVGGILDVKLLNPELVKDDLKTSEALAEAFIKHQDDPKLFMDVWKFRKVKP